MNEFHLTPIKIDQLSHSNHPFQTSFWAYLKQKNGWKPYAFRINFDESDRIIDILILTKVLPPVFAFAYIPFANLLEDLQINEAKFIQQFSRKVKKEIQQPLLFLRYDFPFLDTNEDGIPHIRGRRIKECKDSVQPEATNIIDLTHGYEHVKNEYRQRAKRAIRKLENDEITIRECKNSKDMFEQWYKVYSSTAKRDGFSTRSKEYISSLLYDKNINRNVDLILAIYNNKVVGGTITISSNDYVVYLFGASLRIQGISPSYLLQDYSILKACKNGKKYYDLHGISGPGNRGGNLSSLTLFKQSFGGKRYYRLPSTDYVYIPFVHGIYTFLENIRYSFYRKRTPQVLRQQYGISQDN